ncbi:MAG: hypothetical protein IMF11_08985 [Proteobacteria bacterium]|nr:hypothetical protein [Pseudomonadota bacterium]
MMGTQAKEKLVKAIESLADRITDNVKANEALKFTQAASNAANTIRYLDDCNFN